MELHPTWPTRKHAPSGPQNKHTAKARTPRAARPPHLRRALVHQRLAPRAPHLRTRAVAAEQTLACSLFDPLIPSQEGRAALPCGAHRHMPWH